MMPIWILLLDEDQQNKLEKLFRDFSKQMYYIAAKKLDCHEDIEDAVGDAFIKIADNMEKLENRSIDDVHAFCAVVAKNAAKDIQRKNIRRQKHFTELNEDITPSPLDIIEQYELNDIKQHLAELPDDLRDALWMYYYIGITVKEIAKIQCVKSVTVYKRIERGLSLLRNKLEAGDENAD